MTKTELDCAPYRESGTVESRWADFRFRITSEPRFQKLMRVDFSVQATLVHRACWSLKAAEFIFCNLSGTAGIAFARLVSKQFETGLFYF